MCSMGKKEETENIPAVGNDFSGVVGGRRWAAAEEGGRRRWASLGSPTVSSVAASLGGEKRTRCKARRAEGKKKKEAVESFRANRNAHSFLIFRLYLPSEKIRGIFSLKR